MGYLFETGRDVDPVTIDVLAIDDDIADIDADAVSHPALFRNGRVALRHSALNIDGEKHGIDDAAELHQSAVPRELYDAAVIFGGFGLYQLFTVGL